VEVASRMARHSKPSARFCNQRHTARRRTKRRCSSIRPDLGREYQLEPDIRLGCEVFSVERAGDRWHLETSDGRFQARYLVAASGIQNQPFVPDVDRFSSSLVEYHSSSLPASENLSGRRVTVVGGGASSWDLLDRAIESGASRVDWVYRETRWFLPTTKSKDAARPNLRELATMQVMNRSPEAVTERLRSFLSAKYRFFGLDDIEPEEPFDLRRHQLAPGRSAMIRNFGTIRRHKSEVRSIRGREVELASGERLETDVLLWGTGYRMNLSYLSLPELAGIRKVSELCPKLGSLVRSLDYPNLFFLGMSLIESTSATPFLAAIEARSIAAHVAGRCEIPLRPVHSHIAYWDLVRFFAAFDRSSYPPLFWRLGYTLMPWWNQTFQDRTVRI